MEVIHLDGFHRKIHLKLDIFCRLSDFFLFVLHV